MLIGHPDILILTCNLCKLCSGHGIYAYGTRYLCHVGVVASLIQASHGIQQGYNLHQCICISCGPVNAYQAHPAIGRDGLEDGLTIDCRADIFQPQSGYPRIRRYGQISQAGLITDCQVGDRGGQVQGFEDAAYRQEQTGYPGAIKVYMLQIGASGYVHGLREVWAVTHVQCPEEYVVAQMQVRQVGVAVALRGVS